MPIFSDMSEDEKDKVKRKLQNKLKAIIIAGNKLEELLRKRILTREERSEIEMKMLKLERRANDIRSEIDILEFSDAIIEAPSENELNAMINKVREIHKINVEEGTTKAVIQGVVKLLKALG
jgi:hypothetical protein